MCRHFLNGSHCSFEDGECGWRAAPSRGAHWRRLHAPPKAARPSCPSSGATFSVDGGQSRGQQGAAVLRSPLFPPPLRNSPCEVQFSMCSGGHQRGALSLWIVENSTGPEEQRKLWQSFSETKTDRGWKHITVPLYGLADWFWLQFSTDGPGQGSAISVDNISFSMDCFLASNGEFPPIVPSTTTLQHKPTNQNIKTTTATNGNGGPQPHILGTDDSTKWTFHTCGATGPEGPTPTQCNSSYRNTNINVSVGTRSPFKGIQIWRIPETGTYR